MKNKSYIALAVALVILQLVAGSSISFFNGRINLVLAVLIILVNLADFHWVVLFATASGLLLDVYSGLPFGLLAGSLFLTALALKLLFDNLFSNFSFHSLLLFGLIAVLLHNLFFAGLVASAYLLGFSDYFPQRDYFYKVLWQIATTELLMVGAYYFINFWSKKFKPVFIT
ncbi:MAG: hypothetical protein WC517_00310 [Patescibacteria group bacterium]